MISWEKKTTINIQSHCTRITLVNNLLFLFFFFLQVCFWAIYDKKLKFSFILATSCEYDNVEVKEISVMSHAS